MKRYTLYFTIVFAIAGCETVIDIDIPVDNPKLTLNATFHKDSLLRASLSLSQHILENGIHPPVEDALIVIYQNDNPIDTLIHQKKGNYFSKKLKPVEGGVYTIRAQSPNHPVIEATSNIPVGIPLKELVILEGNTQDDGFAFTIKFDDPVGEANYYELELYQEYYYVNPVTNDTIWSRHRSWLETDDPAFSEEEDTFNSIIFSDTRFNGKEFSLKITAGSHSTGTKFKLHFNTLSKDLYQYKVTANLQESTSGDPFAQPVKVYNNIANGFGIFAGYSAAVYELKK